MGRKEHLPPMGKKLVEAAEWGLYAVTEIAQGLLFTGIVVDPKNASDSTPVLNYAKARRLSGVRFIGKSLRITDPVKVERIKAGLITPASFVDAMAADAADAKAGKVAVAAIADLEAKMANIKG